MPTTETDQRGAKGADYLDTRQTDGNGRDQAAAHGLQTLLARLMVFAEQSEVPAIHQQLMSDYVALRRAFGHPVPTANHPSPSRLAR